ncbi:MAG TPA: CAP domain-containing protein [Phycisphaerales bacterium]|nr:CAP domain-containing protein [Phycisphaerales bacterium]
MNCLKIRLFSLLCLLTMSAPTLAEVTYKVTFENGMMKVTSSPDANGNYEVYTVPSSQVRLQTYKVGDSRVTPADTAPSPTLTEAQIFEAEVLRLTNENRRRRGLEDVAVHGSLQQAAEGHSQEMLKLGYFSHTSPVKGRSQPGDRVRLAGADPLMVSENIFQCTGHDPTGAAKLTVQEWMDSPGHRQNILDPQATHVGIGYAKEGRIIVVTQVFGGGL